MIFDCIVIGKGLIGAAAAKYVGRNKKPIAIIGPDEPVDPNDGIVFASHYDQGRIQRIIGTDKIWTLLNLQSAREYDSLEKESGISFHSGVGCLYVNPTGADDYLNNLEHQSKQFDIKYTYFKNAADIKKSFPDFNLPQSSQGIFEDAPSGYINPRLLIKAQLHLFQKNNGTILNDVANEIEYIQNYFHITTLNGNIYQSKKVLLCPGAFINFFNLSKKKLYFDLKGETTIWAKVSAQEAKRLSSLPSLLYEIDIPLYKNVYLIQPVQYPDGDYYVKMGCNLPQDMHFDNLQDIQDWFRNGDSDANLNILKEALGAIMPTLTIEKFFTKRCIVSFTKHGKPYIGALDADGLYVACGGNGYSAMCSDALGNIAARLLNDGVFPEEYPTESFQPIAEK